MEVKGYPTKKKPTLHKNLYYYYAPYFNMAEKKLQCEEI